VTDERTRGLAAGIAAYALWGLLPLYLKLLSTLSAVDVLAHRVIWSAAVLALVAVLGAGWSRAAVVLKQPRLVLQLAASTMMIAVNWLVYTWAVMNGRALDTSLGYFMLPLLNIALGVLLLKEPFPRARQLAVGLALAGVAVLTIARGALPWVSVVLALSFGFYGFIRKFTAVDAASGLFIETALLTPFGAAWLLSTPAGIAGHAWPMLLLLAGSGIVTTVPLVLFGFAARRLSLSMLGFLQYLAPSMVFLIAWLGFGEPLDAWRLAAFALTWAGIAVFVAGSLRRRAKPATA
jgi:chloramphenicol-sensitive protein RarD